MRWLTKIVDSFRPKVRELSFTGYELALEKCLYVRKLAGYRHNLFNNETLVDTLLVGRYTLPQLKEVNSVLIRNAREARDLLARINTAEKEIFTKVDPVVGILLRSGEITNLIAKEDPQVMMELAKYFPEVVTSESKQENYLIVKNGFFSSDYLEGLLKQEIPREDGYNPHPDDGWNFHLLFDRKLPPQKVVNSLLEEHGVIVSRTVMISNRLKYSSSLRTALADLYDYYPKEEDYLQFFDLSNSLVQDHLCTSLMRYWFDIFHEKTLVNTLFGSKQTVNSSYYVNHKDEKPN